MSYLNKDWNSGLAFYRMKLLISVSFIVHTCTTVVLVMHVVNLISNASVVCDYLCKKWWDHDVCAAMWATKTRNWCKKSGAKFIHCQCHNTCSKTSFRPRVSLPSAAGYESCKLFMMSIFLGEKGGEHLHLEARERFRVDWRHSACLW